MSGSGRENYPEYRLPTALPCELLPDTGELASLLSIVRLLVMIK